MDPWAYDFWLVDLDGTLVDVDPAYARSVLDRVGDRIGYSFSPDQADRLWYGLGESRSGLLRSWGVDEAQFWATLHDEEDPVARTQATYLYDDARLIGDLDRPVGLVTHCQPYLTDPVLDRLGIREWFDAVVCCSHEIGWKPDPGPVRHAMESMGVGDDGHRGVLVGDGPPDVGAARNAGLDSIHVERHDHRTRGHRVQSDYRVESLAAIDPGLGGRADG